MSEARARVMSLVLPLCITGRMRVPGNQLVVLIGDASRVHDVLIEELGTELVVVTAPTLSEFLRTVNQARKADPSAGIRQLADGLTLDPRCRQITWRGEQLHVTRREFGLLAAFSEEPREVLTFDDLLAAGWGSVDHRDVGLVHSAIMRLRVKLRAAGVPIYIASVWGVGFRLAEGAQSEAGT